MKQERFEKARKSNFLANREREGIREVGWCGGGIWRLRLIQKPVAFRDFEMWVGRPACDSKSFESMQDAFTTCAPSKPTILEMQLTERCHAATERCHAATERCHAATERCHAATERCHAVTERCLAVTERCHALTERCHAATERCHAVTEHCLAVTERCHAVTERCHAAGR
jgi:hypothetical protein